MSCVFRRAIELLFSIEQDIWVYLRQIYRMILKEYVISTLHL